MVIKTSALHTQLHIDVIIMSQRLTAGLPRPVGRYSLSLRCWRHVVVMSSSFTAASTAPTALVKSTQCLTTSTCINDTQAKTTDVTGGFAVHMALVLLDSIALICGDNLFLTES